jgi:hypothetical protein
MHLPIFFLENENCKLKRKQKMETVLINMDDVASNSMHC